jgi:cell division protein ZapA
MAEVTLTIGGRPHRIACRDGEEGRVQYLGSLIEQRWSAAERAAGPSGERAFLFVALMLADSLDEAETRPPPGAAMSDAALARVADRLESLADALEQVAPSA